jgi:hypothetical protein
VPAANLQNSAVLDRKVKGLGLPILYLDFDGVLHPEHCYWHPRKGPYLKAPGHSLFEHLALLERLLEAHPKVRIVLSTTWVQTYQFSETARKLGPSLSPRVIGATYHTGMDKEGFRDMPRGLQVLGDVARRQPSAWVALDDDPTGWPANARDKLVLTHGLHGLGEERAQLELKAKLMALASNQRT